MLVMHAAQAQSLSSETQTTHMQTNEALQIWKETVRVDVLSSHRVAASWLANILSACSFCTTCADLIDHYKNVQARGGRRTDPGMFFTAEIDSLVIFEI